MVAGAAVSPSFQFPWIISSALVTSASPSRASRSRLVGHRVASALPSLEQVLALAECPAQPRDGLQQPGAAWRASSPVPSGEVGPK